MKKLLFSVAALSFIAGAASAADRLSDAQMDRITAGALPTITIQCPGCINANSGQNSSSTNGITVVTNTPGLPNGTGGSGGTNGTGGSGGTNGTGGSGGSGGSGTTNGSGGSGGSPNGGAGGSTGTTTPGAKVTFPPNFLSTIVAVAGFNPVNP